MDVFLDMTGTITDMKSEDYALLKLGEEIKEKFNIKMDAGELVKRINDYRKPFMDRRAEEYHPIRNLVSDAIAHILNRKLEEDEIKWIHKKYVEIHGIYVKLAPRAMEGLEALREIAEHMGIITDGDRPYTEKLLESLDIIDFFDSITTAEDAMVGKPNPRIFQMALRNSKSDTRTYIGDSEERDMVGSKRVGMIAIKIGDSTQHGDFHAKNLVEAAGIIANLKP